ncbi:MAG TPA: PAS domain S-box protein [Prolixibacteraceae bacterium]|jgi:PAS domain S-box-containing protein
MVFRTDQWPAGWNDGTGLHAWLILLSGAAMGAALFVILILFIQFIKKKPISFLATARPLRTSRDFEEELRQHKKSESKFMGLLESAPDAMVITSHEGKILMVNAQTENFFGYQRDELIGKRVEILVPERVHHQHILHRQGYVDHPKVRGMGIGMNLFGRRKDGSEFPVEISLSPMKIMEEDVMMVISAIRDITKQKETEKEIIQLNENLEQLVIKRTSELEYALKKEKTARSEMNHDQLRMALLTEASNVLASSLDYFETLTNLSRILTPAIADWCAIDEVEEDGTVKRIVVSHIDPEKVNLVYELAEKYPPHTYSLQGVYEVIRTLQSEIYPTIPDELIESVAQNQEHLELMQKLSLKSAIIVPLYSRDKIYGVLSLLLSNEERHFDEKDLEFANELGRRTTLAIENAKLYKKLQDNNSELEVRVAQRTVELEAINKELEAFSYSVSHDLRAPLRSIDGFSNKILKDYGDLFDEQGKDYFFRVKNASQHMGHLIDDLIKLSRISRVEINTEAINLSLMASSIVTELKESDPERKTGFYIQDEMMAHGDKNLIQIALQNLLENAWKYSRNEPFSKIEFGTLLKNEQRVYFIRDNGVGFDMKYADKLFGAFQRLHSLSEFEGTGIGLATVQRIIRRHHGTIWADSEVNVGTTFFFTL